MFSSIHRPVGTKYLSKYVRDVQYCVPDGTLINGLIRFSTDIMSLKGQMAAEPVEALMRMEIGLFIKRYVVRQNYNMLYSGML